MTTARLADRHRRHRRLLASTRALPDAYLRRHHGWSRQPRTPDLAARGIWYVREIKATACPEYEQKSETSTHDFG